MRPKISNVNFVEVFCHQGVNFINILQAAFMRQDPKSVKIQSSYQYLFALLGSAPVEAVSKSLRNRPQIGARQHPLHPEGDEVRGRDQH